MEEEWKFKCGPQNAPWLLEAEWTEKCPVPAAVVAGSTAVNTEADEPKKKPEFDLITAEEKDHGPVTFQDYRNFFSFSIGTSAIFIYATISIACSVLQMLPTYIVTLWTSLPPDEQQKQRHYLWYFLGSALAYMVVVLMRSLSL